MSLQDMIKSTKLKKAALLGAILIAIAIYVSFGLDRYLTLAALKKSQTGLTLLYHEHPITVIGAYIAVYILVTALSIPAAAMLGLLGGAIFGLVAGTVIVSFASTIGATLACGLARYLLRDMVQTRFSTMIDKINEGIIREGAFYLFTLRLIPAVPFFAVNLAMGLTRMPLFTFFWVSQAGMLAGTVIIVNAGKELASIDSIEGIFSPGLILSFALLGLFPLVVKKIYRRRY